MLRIEHRFEEEAEVIRRVNQNGCALGMLDAPAIPP
jgi:hypothetical protein